MLCRGHRYQKFFDMGLKLFNQIYRSRLALPAPARILGLKENSIQPKAGHVTATALDFSHVEDNGLIFQICEQNIAAGGH